jgi:hypothetical protein
MPHDYVVAIPSKGRSKNISKDTLRVLKEYNIPSNKIYLFLDDEQEKKDYERDVPSVLYGKIVVTHQPGSISGIRNYIVDYFPEDTKIVSMDDDVLEFQTVDKRGKAVPVKSLHSLIERGFALCEERGYTLWGVYPIANPFYLKVGKDYTTDLRFIVGSFMAFINKKRKVHTNFKEDYELSLEAYKHDGGVIRFNRVGIKFKMHTKKGGISKTPKERLKDNLVASAFLLKKYPTLVRRNTRRNGGEIMLRKREMGTKKIADVPK